MQLVATREKTVQAYIPVEAKIPGGRDNTGKVAQALQDQQMTSLGEASIIIRASPRTEVPGACDMGIQIPWWWNLGDSMKQQVERRVRPKISGDGSTKVRASQ